MGKLNKYANLYDKEGNLIRQADPVLKPFSIKELEDYLDSLDKGTLEYNNCMSWLMNMYQNPKTEKDKEYVQELQENLIKKLQDEQDRKKRREEAGRTSLEQLNKDIEDAQIISESVSDSADRGDTEGKEAA